MHQPLETHDFQEIAETEASVSGNPARLLNQMQRDFAANYVANGGKSTAAAEAAGYSSAATMGSKLKLNPRVQALIRKLSIVNIEASLPAAIQALLDICEDVQAAPKDRIKAAVSLLDRAGVRGADGPSVAVQVNVGGSEPASTVIRSVWDARQARMSSIAAPMRDTIEQVEQAENDDPEEPAGGG